MQVDVNTLVSFGWGNLRYAPPQAAAILLLLPRQAFREAAVHALQVEDGLARGLELWPHTALCSGDTLPRKRCSLQLQRRWRMRWGRRSWGRRCASLGQALRFTSGLLGGGTEPAQRPDAAESRYYCRSEGPSHRRGRAREGDDQIR